MTVGTFQSLSVQEKFTMSEVIIPSPNENSKTVFSSSTKDFHIPGKYLETCKILDACRSAINIMHNFGKAFSAIIYDLENILSKVETVYREDPKKYEFLEHFAQSGIREDGTFYLNENIDNIVWLERLLRFWCLFLQLIIDDIEKGRSFGSG